MNKNKHLISKYLGGELDALTAARFEENLKHDPELHHEMEFYKKVNKALADTEVIKLRMQLREMHTKHVSGPIILPKPRLKRVARIAVAASLAVLFCFSAINFFRIDNKSQKLLEKFYQPYEVTSANRSSSIDEDRILRNALEKYQNRQYGEAVILFEKVLKNNTRQMMTQLYSGISYFEIADYQKAEKSFSMVIEHNDNLYIEQAKWYLGFCYLKTEEKEKAIKQFTEIANSDSYYSEKAKKILKKLR